MKRFWIHGIVALALAATAGALRAQQPGSGQANEVDYARYEGRYYEMARLPTSKERDCASDVVTTFIRRTDGDASVIFQCFEEDGTWLMDVGLLRVKSSTAGRGEIEFRADLIGLNPWYWGTYNLIELASDFDHAMFGSPDRSQLWILSRTRKMAGDTYQRLLGIAGERGYDTARLVRPVQKGI